MIVLRFVGADDIPSDLIQWFGGGAKVSHVDAVVPPFDAEAPLLGARLDGGVKQRPWDYEAFPRACRVELPCSESMAGAFYAFLRGELGKPYDKTAIAAFAAGRDWREPDSWFCSELQAAALEASGFFPWPLATPANKVTPADLLLVLSGLVKIALD